VEIRFILPLQKKQTEEVMEANQRSIKELRSGLSSSDTSILIQTLQEVKSSGSPVLIPELTGLLRRTKSQEIRDHIIDILNNLKYQSSADELVKELRKEDEPDVISYLIAACWKNGLDFSSYIDDFIEAFIRFDYIIALDALTVIENATRNLERAATTTRINRLKQHIDQMEENKRVLLLELIHVLKNKVTQ